MFNVFRILISAIILGWSGGAYALEFTSGLFYKTLTLGTCSTGAQLLQQDQNLGITYVRLLDSNPYSLTYSGAQLWQRNDAGSWVIEDQDPLTAARIESCLGAVSGSVEILANVGPEGTADEASYRAQDYLGFKYKYDGKIYDYALRGANSTTFTLIITDDPTYPSSISPSPSGSGALRSATVDTQFENNIKVEVKNSDGVSVEGVEVIFESSNKATPTDANAIFDETTNAMTKTVTTDANGIAEVPAWANDVVGTYTVTATVVGDTTKTTTFNLENKSDDTVDPTVTITAPAKFDFGVPFEVTFTFDEDVTGFDSADDINVTNGTAAAPTGSGKIYKAMITPSSNAPVKIKLPADVADDAAGNGNAASDEVTVQPADTDGPTVTISGEPETFDFGVPFEVTFTFDEDVTGFDDADDITVTNGTITAPTGSGAEYTATITPNGTGDVTIQVKAGVAADAADNPNTASEVVTVKGTVVEKTQEVIADYMTNRARALIANQPDLINLLTGGSGSFSGGGNDDGGNLDFVSDPNKPIWLRIGGSWSKNGDTKSNYVFGAAGIHYKFNKNFLAGVMVEFDHVNSDSEESNVKGTGWLAGPYMVAKLPDQPLYFDARLLWGKSKNEISPFGTYTDTFDTERLLARLKVSGDLIYDGFTLTPNVIGTYTTDNQESYTDSLNNVIPSQKVTLGEVSAGLDFSVPIDVATGKFNLVGGIAGIYSHTDVSGGSSATLEANSEYRGRVDLGFNYAINQNITVDFKTFYDGIGAQDQYTYGLDGGVKVKF